MIFWIFIYVLVLATTALLIAQELINGTNVVRFNIIILLFFVIILMPLFVGGEYYKSLTLYNDYKNLEAQIDTILPEQEYYFLQDAILVNYKLTQYQEKMAKLGIIAPYKRQLKRLPLIQLRSFDLEQYKMDGEF